MSDSKDLLKLPDMMPVDHLRHCPLYTNVLTRSVEDGIATEEIDDIQMDLETLLIAASSRMRKLQNEITILSDLGEGGKKEKRKDVDSKRVKSQEDRPSKKLKMSDSPSHVKPSPGSSGSSIGKPKAKSIPVKIQETNLLEEQQQLYQPSRVPVHEAPSKFWQSVEPFCQPIQYDTIKMLEQMCQAQLDNEEYFKVPELGMHFSQRWAMEDMREEQSEGSRPNVKKCEKNDDSVQDVMKKAIDSNKPEDSNPFGSLTQRLISAFVDENIMAPPENTTTVIETGKADGIDARTDNNGNTKTSKSLSAVHVNKLEHRIKMELIEQGILEPDTVDSKNEDEILNEIKSCQQELKAVSKQNRDVLQQLLQVAKDELKKQEIRKKVESANTEVMEHYRRVMAARQKKRTLMKKEKDSAWKALRDRESLVKQLESS